VGIDQMSLAALIIALGMLVDNAIVMSESILVSMAEGKAALEAAVESATELRIPLLTSSLTTAAAFLPIYLAESAVGEYTAPLFQVVTITLLCSWALSLTLIPLLCVVFLKVQPSAMEEEYDSRFYRLYRRFLLVLLRHRLASLAVVALVFVGAMQLAGLVPVIFFPPNDRPTFTAELLMPVGTPLEATEQVAIQVENFLGRELGDLVTTWSTFIGAGAPRFVLSYAPEQSSPDYAILVANTIDRAATDQAVERLRAFTDTIPDLKAKIDPLPNGPPAANPIEVRISGRAEDEVFALVEQVKARLGQTPGVRNIGDNWGARSKKLLVRIDESRAQLAGVTNQDVAISLQTLLSGFTTTEYREGDKIIPVVMRSVQSDRVDLGKLESLNVFSQLTGRSVPLKQVADLEVAWQPAKIWRRNRLKTVTVEADLDPNTTAAQVNAQLAPWLEAQSADWPLGYSWELGGEEEESSKANASILEKLPIAGLLIVLLLVAQFNSLRKPLIILITIPLGLIGVIIGLLVLDSYFGFMTFLGVISLAGVVINNAIVLLDRIRIEIEDNGLEPQRAILMSAQRRLRPILLTTFTTLGGLIPLYLGGGPMFEPMAVAIMFGLVFATLLTLGVVPVLYALFYRVGYSGFRW
jgi:multidrug efflux pump subunit AcrB